MGSSSPKFRGEISKQYLKPPTSYNMVRVIYTGSLGNGYIPIPHAGELEKTPSVEL